MRHQPVDLNSPLRRPVESTLITGQCFINPRKWEHVDLPTLPAEFIVSKQCYGMHTDTDNTIRNLSMPHLVTFRYIYFLRNRGNRLT